MFGKVYGDGGAATTASGLRVLRQGLAGLPDGAQVVVPRPLGVVPSLGLGLVETVPGRPLLPDLVKAACAAGGQKDERSVHPHIRSWPKWSIISARGRRRVRAMRKPMPSASDRRATTITSTMDEV